MVLSAPIKGKLIPIKDVPDPVFAEKMLGDGFSVEDSESKKVIVTASTSGVVKTINENHHAFVIETDDGIQVLTHIGIDTVSLKGKGFKMLTKVGKRVKTGDKMVKVDLAFIRDKVPSTMIIVVIMNKPDMIVRLSKVDIVSAKDIVCELDIAQTAVNPVSGTVNFIQNSEPNEFGEWILVPNPHGFHARPAAVLAKHASAYSIPILLEKEGGRKVDAKSSTLLMGLGLNFNDKVRVYCSDKDAIQKIGEAIKAGLGEQVEDLSKNSVSLNTDSNINSTSKTSTQNIFNINFKLESCLKLPVASPGLVFGEIVVIKEVERSIVEKGESSDQEKKKLESALQKAIEDIQVDMKKVDDASVEILEAHKAFLMDPELKKLAYQNIENGKSAAYSWNNVTRNQANIFIESGNSYMAERAADMKDINNRILDILLGEVVGPSFHNNSIVVMYEITPSDVTKFSSHVKGVVTTLGSPTSHASIMLRNRGIPSLYQVPEEILQAPIGIFCVIDTDKGLLFINPKQEEKENYIKSISQMKQKKEAALLEATKKGETQDGHRIEVTGNVSSIKEAKEATSRGAEGFGLARSEFLFYGRKTAPSEEEQRALYQGLLDVTTHMVTVRLLDAGGDKPLPYVKIAKEPNPQLGVRGMRIIEDNEEIYRTQIRALLRCKDLDRLRIMTPMIAMLSEVYLLDRIIKEEAKLLGLNKLPQIGIMAETPAVCVMSEQFAPHVDFFSVGTNDLTQYTMAMDRENSRLAPLSSAANPAVLLMVHYLCKGAKKFNTPVAVCGAVASDPLIALLFVGLGVTELASSGETLPEVKAAVRKYTMKYLKDIAERVLRANSEDEVKEIAKKAFDV